MPLGMPHCNFMGSSLKMLCLEPNKIFPSLRLTGKPHNSALIWGIVLERKITGPNSIQQAFLLPGSKTEAKLTPLLMTPWLGGLLTRIQTTQDLLGASKSLNDHYCFLVSFACTLLMELSVSNVVNQDFVRNAQSVNFVVRKTNFVMGFHKGKE